MSNVPLMLLLVVAVPLVLAGIAHLLGRRLSILARLLGLIGTAGTLYLGVRVWLSGEEASWALPNWQWLGTLRDSPVLHVDALSGFMLAAACLFALLIVIYSLSSVRGKELDNGRFYGHILAALAAAAGALLANNFVVLAIFWGFMGLPFYLLINMGKENCEAAGKKMFIITGASDSLLLLGIGLLLAGEHDLGLYGEIATSNAAMAGAFLCFSAAAFAKAGGMPLHSWIPDVAETAPVPVVAFLPASVDKLLGIYLLARISLHTFTVTGWVGSLLMILGAITIVAAVSMALIQHNLRRLLGFHAVSQVGYMILGIGTGSVLGIAGGLFHMLNNAVYKSCLFLTAGAAERRTGTGDLDKMGGLYKALPVTFLAAVIAALAISGIPPLNGFFSKWMVYQAVIEMGRNGGWLWIVLLVAAIFGSALTLASFVKVIHSVFLGQEYKGADKPPAGPKAGLGMRISMVVLAGACVVFGIWAMQVPLEKMIYPAMPETVQAIGLWQPQLATGLILLAIAAGLVIYLLGSVVNVRRDDSYVGGADVSAEPEMRFSAADFYQTISKEMPILRRLYVQAEKSWYDFYALGRRLIFYVGGGLRALHSGLLLTYVAWCVLGLVLLVWLFVSASK
ncbi:MAG: NADH dehydrogenase [Phycisphaerae bacterium]|nr:NADH dehydrogenase [Phycisphaerae bacterium]